MSHSILQTIRQRVAEETGLVRHSWSNRYRVALVYPSTYHQGMSNLGFQSVYRLLNEREDCLCERFFLPDPHDLQEHKKTGFPLVSYETQTPLSDFDLIALSISFENDYLNLPHIFELGRVPLYVTERSPGDPLVLFGGVCAFLNPEPLADIADIVAVGEAEPILPALLDTLQEITSTDCKLWAQLAVLPGVYLPHYSQPHRPRRQFLADLDISPSRSFLHAEDTEFGDMSLTEVSRGCSRGCRFCAAGYIYLPPRERNLENLLGQVDNGLCQRTKIGLVGAAVADYSQFDALQRGIIDRGGTVSVSSLRLDALTTAEVANLRNSGLRTAAIAPEAGSQRLRDLINKNLSEEQILHAVQLLADGEIRNLKLYFLIGLPTEELADLDELLALTDKIRLCWREAGRSRGQMGSVTLSVNPFIPKPFTPLQWAGMESEKSLKKKVRYLHAAIAQMPNTELISESIRGSVLQAYLSRGDRKVGQLLPQLAQGGNLKQICKKAGIVLDDYVTREREKDEPFPWEVIEQGFPRTYLWREYQNGLQGKLSPPCAAGCTRCGICRGSG